MPQIKEVIKAILLAACLLSAAGCSKGSSSSIIDPDTGRHASNWIVGHRASFLSDQERCKECHGDDIRGGVSNVSCYSASFEGASCHANGPNSHPDGWSDPGQHGAAAKYAPSATSGFSYCGLCHGEDFSGGIINVSCFTCHEVSAPHSPAPWRNGDRTHTNTYGTNAEACAACHTNGANSTLQPDPFDSGAAPGCFNNTLCHDWRGHASGFSDSAVHGVQAKADLTVCQQCHASSAYISPGSNPRFNVTQSTLINGCEDCHDTYAAHPVPWVDHYTSGNLSNACGLCHGAGLTGGVGPSCTQTCHMESADSVHPASWAGLEIYRGHSSYVDANGSSICSNQYCHGTLLTGVAESGPSCDTCHDWPGYAYSPGTLYCTACHGNPPSGTEYPDTAGKHAEHTALANVDCSACHSGAGDGTSNHYSGAVEVSFSAEFNSNGRTASFDADAMTCSAVSCHGGPRTQTYGQALIFQSTPTETPHWLTGAIDVDTECKACHVYDSLEYNCYGSGEHRTHVYRAAISCTECHDTSLLLADHFSNLNTPAMSGARFTIYEDISSNGWSCAIVCHGVDHTGL